MPSCTFCGSTARDIELAHGDVCCEVEEPEMYFHLRGCGCADCHLERFCNPREEDDNAAI